MIFTCEVSNHVTTEQIVSPWKFNESVACIKYDHLKNYIIIKFEKIWVYSLIIISFF